MENMEEKSEKIWKMWKDMENTYLSSIFFIYFHNFLLYFPNHFTIRLAFVPYFSYHFIYQLSFLPYFPYHFTFQLNVRIIWKKGRFNSDMIWKLWKKSKLKCETIWKLWRKSKLNCEMIRNICNLHQCRLLHQWESTVKLYISVCWSNVAHRLVTNPVISHEWWQDRDSDYEKQNISMRICDPDVL
jgi:hypothetical protein